MGGGGSPFTSLRSIIFLGVDFAECIVLFCSNVAVFVIKLLAYFHTGSAAMLSEAIHSLVDALNQVKETGYQLELALFPGLSLSLFFSLVNIIYKVKEQ